MSTPQVAEGIF